MDQMKVRRRVMTPTSDPHTTDLLLGKSPEYNRNLEYFFSLNKFKWYCAPVFLAFWLFLYSFIAIPMYHSLPKPLSIKDEAKYPGRFIAERAEKSLQKLIELGPRVVGSMANERDAIKFFMSAVEKLKAEVNPVNEIEVDIQVASGSYCHWEMINMYQSIQNVVIKLSPKVGNSTSYLLVNSHYDSVPGGPGAGDDGTMVAIMLETIRVLSQSSTPLKHPVVFLFNGAEENPLQASHAFITQHKWAKNCKALINLDSAGNGGREILFQSGPNHPWLMKYYRTSVMHPYASTIAEEMFQRHLIPSDTDFRIFRDHGRVPGLDMAHSYNGYVYHTKFDRPEIIPRGTFQNTGDNILALTRAIANAPELEDPSQYSEGHTIFFDVLGSFMVFYTHTEGIILNVLVSVFSIAAIGISFQVMASSSGLKMQKIIKQAAVMFGVVIASVIVATVLVFLIGILMDLMHMPMAWFTQGWLILGLYFCPLFFGIGILPAMYIGKLKKNRLSLGYMVQLLLHCHCLFLVFLTLALTICGIRSAFVCMLTILFYTSALIINLATKLHNRPLAWLGPHVICQILPFIFFAYVFHGFFVTFIPMTGRFGAKTNPDLIICAFSVASGILIGGFMIPVLNLFQKSKTIICSLLGITLICIVIAATPLGFPYRPETSVQRFSILHARRVFHAADSTVRRIEMGYFILPNDRRTYSVNKHVINMTLAQNLNEDCEKEIMCGLPLYNHRWMNARSSSIWIPGPDPVFDKIPEINVTAKYPLSKSTIRYELQFSGPDHMALFIQPLKNAKVTAWSFHHTPLRMEWKPPYFVYFSYGVNSKPLSFFLEFEKESGDWSKPTFEIAIVGHWNHHEYMQTPDFKKFLHSFPKYVEATAWPSSFESFQF